MEVRQSGEMDPIELKERYARADDEGSRLDGPLPELRPSDSVSVDSRTRRHLAEEEEREEHLRNR
jgi:hypothetical protein